MISDRRWALTGVLGIGLLGVALLLPGAPVTSDEPVARVAETLARDHVQFGLSAYLGAVGLVALIAFAAAIRRSAGSEVAAVSIVVAAVLIVTGMSLSTGLGVQPDVASRPEVVRAGVDTGNVLIELAKLPVAAMIVALLPGTSGALRVGGVLAAVIAVVTGLPPLLASSGPMQFGGVVDLGGAVPAFVWIAVFSVALARRTGMRVDGRVRANEDSRA